MEKIMGFSDDELVVKILLFLPTKDAIRTCVLSKKWRFLWKRITKVDYSDNNNTTQSKKRRLFNINRNEQRLLRFIHRNLPTQAPILETLNLNFTTIPFTPHWFEIAVSGNNLRHLTVSFSSMLARLPVNLYSSKTLISLKLYNAVLVNAPGLVHLPSLKTLHLGSLYYSPEFSLQQILSNCPVLEDLSVEGHCHGLRNFNIIVPSLQRLSIYMDAGCVSNEFVIDTPSLKYLKVRDESIDNNYSCLNKNMPLLKEAEIDVKNSLIPKFFRSITSVTRLSLTVNLNDNYGGEGMQRYCFVFNEIELVKLITSNASWLDLLAQLLRHSSN